MNIHYLDRPEGRLSYTVEGSGPLVVAVPGMGDLRSTYTDLVPGFVAAGYRVAVLDLPGHGASDTTFTRFTDDVVGGHILALIEKLGGPAVVVGNSIGGASAIWAAGDKPDAVAGLVLSSPFIRESASRSRLAFNRVLFRVLMQRAWGVGLWANLYRSSFAKGPKPAWFDEHVAEITANLREPGRMKALRMLSVQLDHDVVEPLVDRVTAPVFIAVGSLDPDYPDPASELAYMGERLHAETVLVEGAAHYSHFQAPEVFIPRAIAFMDGLTSTSGWRDRA